MSRLGTWLVTHSRLVVALVLAVTLVFAVFALRLRLDFNYGDLLPLWAEGRYFPLLYSRGKVEEAAKNRLRLEPAAIAKRK